MAGAPIGSSRLISRIALRSDPKCLPVYPLVAYNSIESPAFQKAPLVDADRFYIQNAPNLVHRRIPRHAALWSSGRGTHNSGLCSSISRWVSTSVALVCGNVPGVLGHGIGCAKGLTDRHT